MKELFLAACCLFTGSFLASASCYILTSTPPPPPPGGYPVGTPIYQSAIFLDDQPGPGLSPEYADWSIVATTNVSGTPTMTLNFAPYDDPSCMGISWVVGNLGGISSVTVQATGQWDNCTTQTVFFVYTTLPIELGGFSAEKASERVRLDWNTHSETDNRGFDIERSPDGLSFEKIGFAAGRGTSTERHDYLFFDESPLLGISYYRLRQIDLDGKATLSPVASVDMGEGRPELALFPNPVAGGLLTSAMRHFNGGEATVSISNAVGQVVAVRHFDALLNEKLDWVTTGWPPGAYQMTVEQAGFAPQTRRFAIAP